MATSSNSLPIFSGEYRHTLDGKNRVTIPSCWRNEELDEFFVIVSPSRGCLTAMPAEVFMKIGEEAKARYEPAKLQAFIGPLYAMAKRVTIDRQGRLLLNEDQCKLAGLCSDTVLTGSRDRFEIWSPGNWVKYLKTQRPSFEEVAKEFGL
jgi:MraZ protein